MDPPRKKINFFFSPANFQENPQQFSWKILRFLVRYQFSPKKIILQNIFPGDFWDVGIFPGELSNLHQGTETGVYSSYVSENAFWYVFNPEPYVCGEGMYIYIYFAII